MYYFLAKTNAVYFNSFAINHDSYNVMFMLKLLKKDAD